MTKFKLLSEKEFSKLDEISAFIYMAEVAAETGTKIKEYCDSIDAANPYSKQAA